MIILSRITGGMVKVTPILHGGLARRDAEFLGFEPIACRTDLDRSHKGTKERLPRAPGPVEGVSKGCLPVCTG